MYLNTIWTPSLSFDSCFIINNMPVMKNGNGGGLAVYITYDCQTCQAIPEVSKLNITVNKVEFIQDKAMYGGGVYMYAQCIIAMYG